MKKVKVNDLVIGSTIVEPINRGDVLLCKEGTIVTKSIKRMLEAFNVDEVSVDTIYVEKIDNIISDFQQMNKLTSLSLKHLELNDIVICAKQLVTNLVNTDNAMLISNVLSYDPGTYHHSMNVAVLSLMCGIKMGLNKNELYILTLGALLHDVGKTVIPLSILNKQGPLDTEERNLMNQHPLIGSEMLRSCGLVDAPVQQIVMQHHENWDGTGYPRKLYGTNSYKLARLVHIADVYEALCSKRPYKKQVSRSKVREFMMEGSGTQFDPTLLKEFLEATPLYFLGEELICGDTSVIVADTTNTENPTVKYGDEFMTVKELEELKGVPVDLLTLKLIR